jgi:hypothetical protein
MALGPEVRAAVRAAYVHQALPLNEASRQCGVRFETARRWKSIARKNGDDWDAARTASYMSGQGADLVLSDVMQSILLLTQSTLRDLRERGDQVPMLERVEAISRVSDAYHKTAAAVGKHSPKISRLAIAIEILTTLTDYVREKHPALAPALLEVLEPFGQELARKYG